MKQKPGMTGAVKIKRKTEVKKLLFVWPMMLYPLSLFAVFWVYKNISSFTMAFQSIDAFGKTSWAGLDNFKTFLYDIFQNESDTILRTAVIRSLLMYGVNLLISMPLYIFFSYAIYKKCPGHALWRFLMMLPNIISAFIFGLLFKRFANGPIASLFSWDTPLRSAGTAFPLILFYMIWVSFGTNMLVYSNAMKEVDDAVKESAKLDGVSGMLSELRYVLIPSIFPTISTFLIVGVAGFLMQSGPLVMFYMYNAPGYVYTTGYYFTVRIFNTPNQTGYPALAAGGLIITAVTVPVVMTVRRALEKLGPSVE
ncbi:MAG: sugar ABC transporter permease [Clostridiales bacterium]|jgi:ABC-type sugar transport system permease subunit|nr:sugar ABC transporter permease [Clostridiales bacterium]